MSANLVSLVMQFLTPDMVGRISTALGLNRSVTQSAVGVAIPALLAAFNNVVSHPGGAQKLADVARQQTGTLGSFASTLAAGEESSFLDSGSQMLSSLVGGQDKNALAGAVAKFTGLGEGASGSLLGMLAPIVMGAIAQQQGAARAFDANGIARLFADQKDNIAAAMPSGFGKLLSGTDLLSSLGGEVRAAAAAGSEAAQAATRAVGWSGQRVAGAAAPASPNRLYWLLPAAAVAIALFIYLAAWSTNEIVQSGVKQTPGLDTQVSNSIASLRTTLDGITDVASAQAALPKLREFVAQIDKVDDGAGQLSAEQRKLLAALVNPAMSDLNQLCDKVLAVPGVAEVLKPSVDAVKAKLTALAA
jgi:hypothetical protein